MNKISLSIIPAFLLCSLLSCNNQEAQSELPADAQKYEVAGRVVSIVTDDNVAFIKHDEIPGFMAAMTMGIRVKKPELLSEIQSGDSVRFTLVVSEGEMFIHQIQTVPE